MIYNEELGYFELEPEEREHPDDDSWLVPGAILANGIPIRREYTEEERTAIEEAKSIEMPPPEPTLQERVEQLEKENEMLGDAIIEVAQLALGGTT